jgi:hypothetical protein
MVEGPKGLGNLAQEPVGFTAKRLQDSAQARIFAALRAFLIFDSETDFKVRRTPRLQPGLPSPMLIALIRAEDLTSEFVEGDHTHTWRMWYVRLSHFASSVALTGLSLIGRVRTTQAEAWARFPKALRADHLSRYQ